MPRFLYAGTKGAMIIHWVAGIVLATGLCVFDARAALAQARKVTLTEAIEVALASDNDLYVAREDARISEASIGLARASFAPRLFGEAYVARDDQPPSVTTFGGVDSLAAGSLGITGRIQTGLTFTLSAGIVRRKRDEDPFLTVFAPGVTTTLRAELVQPLWRGAFAAATRPIVVASLRRERSLHELRARLEITVGTVQIAYWNLVRARGERDARTSAFALAKEQVDESKRLLRLGTGSSLDVVEAEAGVSRREQELLRTEQDVVEAEGRLFEALGLKSDTTGWSGQTIEPTDAPQVEPFTGDIEAEVAHARAHRGEMLAARDAIAAETAELALRDNARRPAIDLVAAAGTVGFAGVLQSNYATAGVNGMPPLLDPLYTTNPAYDGGLTRSLKNTFGDDTNVYIGVRFQVPFGDNELTVRHGIQARTVTRAKLSERDVAAQIESQVRTAIARLGVDAKLVAAGDRTVELAEKLLEGMRKRYRAGAATSFDVLRVSEELTRSRIEVARARADYRASRTRLAAATGTLLDSLGITLESLAAAPP